MLGYSSSFKTIRHDPPDGDEERERRLGLLLQRLPQRLAAAVTWLRQPSKRWARVPAGLALIVGGLLSILPIFGLWMLPLGLLLLSEDVRPLRVMSSRLLRWVERRRPHWLGLRHAPEALQIDGQVSGKDRS